MKNSELKFLDKNACNVFEIKFPYAILQEKKKKTSNKNEKKQIIFFGFDFKNIGMSENQNLEKLMNSCLRYIEKEYPGSNLFYKPHPNETDEYLGYDLGFFKILNEKEPAEMYCLKNINEIAATFSVASTATISSYNVGIDSYIFYKIFKETINENVIRHFDVSFKNLDSNFFITDFSKKIPSTKINSGIKKIHELHNLIKKTLPKKAWLNVNHPRFLLEIISIAKILKAQENMIEINLIISKHKTWKNIDLNYLKKYFNNIMVFSRLSYALNFKNLVNLIKTKQAIKKLKIEKNDLIINFSPCEFIENMLISYFKKCLKINFCAKYDYSSYGNLDFLKNLKLYQTKTSIIFNLLIQPALGMRKTFFCLSKNSQNDFTLIKYQKQLEKIYDYIFLHSA